MTEFGEAAEGAISLVVGGFVMILFGSVVTSEYLNIRFIGLLFAVLGVVALAMVVSIALVTAFSG